jgi:hypothetical protein
MTRELKTLMDRATERPDTFMPNPAELVAAGRRSVRNRRLTASVATLAAVVVLAGGAAVAIDLHDSRSTDPASAVPNRPEDAYKLCTSSNGTSLGTEPWGWDEVVSDTDQYGSASIRKRPGQTTAYVNNYAFCISQPEKAVSVATGGRGGILLRKTPVNDNASVTTVFGRAYDPTVRVEVETGDGYTGNAVIRSEFFVYRRLEPRGWPGHDPSAVVRLFDGQDNRTALGRW